MQTHSNSLFITWCYKPKILLQ